MQMRLMDHLPEMKRQGMLVSTKILGLPENQYSLHQWRNWGCPIVCMEIWGSYEPHHPIPCLFSSVDILRIYISVFTCIP